MIHEWCARSLDAHYKFHNCLLKDRPGVLVITWQTIIHVEELMASIAKYPQIPRMVVATVTAWLNVVNGQIDFSTVIHNIALSGTYDIAVCATSLVPSQHELLEC